MKFFFWCMNKIVSCMTTYISHNMNFCQVKNKIISRERPWAFTFWSPLLTGFRKRFPLNRGFRVKLTSSWHSLIVNLRNLTQERRAIFHWLTKNGKRMFIAFYLSINGAWRRHGRCQFSPQMIGEICQFSP